MIESLSWLWQDTQAFVWLHYKKPLSSCHSCPCQKLLLQPKVRQIGSCLSPVWSPRNHIHCKMSCHSFIVMHLTRHSGICLTALHKPTEQLSLLSLSEIVIASQDWANWMLSPVWCLGNNIQCQVFYDRIIVMVMTRHSGICMTALQKPTYCLEQDYEPQASCSCTGYHQCQLFMAIPKVLKCKQDHDQVDYLVSLMKSLYKT